MMDFSRRLKELRKARGITQVQLAEAVGVSQTVISDYEKGKAMPTAPVIVKMARFFGVSTDYLLGLTDNPQPWSNDLPEQVKEQLREYGRLKERYEKLLYIFKKELEEYERSRRMKEE